ncbi:hypothetical protein AKJ09_10603 [Labilithrix luteola]|uniref:Outer membrane lipoprotein BamD-like domain-containing protein n=1 Tax=Labilithrix luteola TaxID=1391654 RepID=A0A0K1QES8_9BACT|nr:hypothetical protein [Labilithrix luteola]AKV03940.1 hypothetical protein AKJ09_10603 [Labilithrix luteola]
MTARDPSDLRDLIAEARNDGPSSESLYRLADVAAKRAAAMPAKNRSIGRIVSRLGTSAIVSAALLGAFVATKSFDAPRKPALTTRDAVDSPSEQRAAERETPAPPAIAPTNVPPEMPTIDVRSLPAKDDSVKGAAANAGDTSEGALLRRAYAATPKEPRQALALTAEHARRFPSSILAEEREVIAIEALARLGRGDEARGRAKAFFAAHPDSAYRLRVDDALSNVTEER